MHAIPLILAAILAQNPSPVAQLRAYHAETAPTIDGRLDEPVWKAADVGGNFRAGHPTGQFQPGQDLGHVFTNPADNIFAIKISRWFGK